MGTAANATLARLQVPVTLQTPLPVAAGTQYWISIRQRRRPMPFTSMRDGIRTQFVASPFDGVYTTYNIDRAYSLKTQ